MVLPSEYKQVKYIQSSGTQYINTGFSPSNKTKVVCKLSSDGIMYGCGVNGQYQALSLMNYNQYYTGRFKTTSSSNQTIQSTVPVGGVHTFENSQVNGFYIDGTLIGTYTQYTFTESRPMYLFAWNGTGGTPPAYGSGPIYYLKIYEDGTLVRDFVPVIRVSDSKPGLYDLVNDVFYTNAGTGEFTYEKYAEKGKFRKILLGESQIYPHKSGNYDFWYSDDNFSEYQSLVDSVGSVQFVDSGRRYRFNNAIYIGDRMAINVNGSTFSKINLDTLTVVSSKSSSVNGRMRYFGNNRILTTSGIMDFDGNMVTSFGTTYNNITPGLPGVVWATDNNKGIYRGAVDGDNVTFTKIGTVAKNGNIFYCKTGAYSIRGSNNEGNMGCYMNPTTKTIAVSSISASGYSSGHGFSGPDGKMYVAYSRENWGMFYRLGTGSSPEASVGTRSSSEWLGYGSRVAHFLGNLVSGAPSDYGATGSGFGSNSTFVSTSGTTTFAQSNALAYDTNVHGIYGFIDENGWIYPTTSDGGNGVILKTNKTFTDFHWRNPYLWR